VRKIDLDLAALARKTKPTYTVQLDAGVFWWLHATIDARRQQHQWVPNYQALTDRAWESFELSRLAQEARFAPSDEPAPTRVIRRRLAKRPRKR
jgi:hypothetical protein